MPMCLQETASAAWRSLSKILINGPPISGKTLGLLTFLSPDRAERLAGEHESGLLQQSVVDHYRRKGDMASARAASFSRFTSAREDKEGLEETTQALLDAADACKTKVSMAG